MSSLCYLLFFPWWLLYVIGIKFHKLNFSAIILLEAPIIGANNLFQKANPIGPGLQKLGNTLGGF